MKKLLIALVVSLVLLAAFASTALADNGPHGGAAFANASTDACASCHRAHTAQGPTYLLVAGDIYGLCTSCHDGTGAYTNVVDGYYDTSANALKSSYAAPIGQQGTSGEGLFAGGFTNARMTHVWNGHNYYDTGSAAPVSAATTSTHDVSGTATGTVWGSGPISGVANNGGTLAGGATLECTSCHDPHGNAGRTGASFTTPTTSYRLLRFNPEGSNGFEGTAAYFTGANVLAGTNGGVYVADVATKWYTPNNDYTQDSTVQAFRTRWDSTNNVWTPWAVYESGQGDYSGRSFIYARPAVSAYASFTAGKLTGLYTCLNGGALPPLPTGQPGSVTAGVDYFTCGATTGTAFSNTAAKGSLGMWCALCHDRYLAASAGRTTASGDAVFMYRHATTGSVVCVDCHVSHGTTAQETTVLAQDATLNTGSTDLLKVDNRSMCAKCHGVDVNFTYTP